MGAGIGEKGGCIDENEYIFPNPSSSARCLKLCDGSQASVIPIAISMGVLYSRQVQPN